MNMKIELEDKRVGKGKENNREKVVKMKIGERRGDEGWYKRRVNRRQRIGKREMILKEGKGKEGKG